MTIEEKQNFLKEVKEAIKDNNSSDWFYDGEEEQYEECYDEDIAFEKLLDVFYKFKVIANE